MVGLNNMNYEEPTMLDIARAAVKAGNAGHWPTVAGVLLDEVERLEGIRTANTNDFWLSGWTRKLEIEVSRANVGNRHLLFDRIAYRTGCACGEWRKFTYNQK